MALVFGKEVLDRANSEGYAVGAFNFTNLETLQAIIQAAEAKKSPVIVQTSEGTIKYMGLENIVALSHVMAMDSDVPVVLHLDHGKDMDIVNSCITKGYTSVMYDGSSMSYEDNVANTRRVVESAGLMGVSVEAELGQLGTGADLFTDPEQACDFAAQTGVDCLAVSIGTQHGPFKSPPKLDFERISAIKEKVGIPLVMHGSSGVSFEDVRKAVSCGINKVNINTDIRQVFTTAVRDVLKDKKVYKIRDYLTVARDAVQKIVEKHMDNLGSSGKC